MESEIAGTIALLAFVAATAYVLYKEDKKDKLPENDTKVYPICPVCRGAKYNWLPVKDMPPKKMPCWACSGRGWLVDEEEKKDETSECGSAD